MFYFIGILINISIIYLNVGLIFVEYVYFCFNIVDVRLVIYLFFKKVILVSNDKIKYRIECLFLYFFWKESIYLIS